MKTIANIDKKIESGLVYSTDKEENAVIKAKLHADNVAQSSGFRKDGRPKRRRMSEKEKCSLKTKQQFDKRFHKRRDESQEAYGDRIWAQICADVRAIESKK